MIEFFEKAAELEREQNPFAVVTLVDSTGHTPQDAGARAIISKDGLLWGTLGGGRVEARAIEKARALIESPAGERRPLLVRWNLQTEIGMSCGGVATYLFEVFGRSPWEIVVFGAGHVAQALIRTLLPLDCRITCIDPRSEWLEKLPESPRLQTKKQEYTTPVNFSHDAFLVLMTQGHQFDLEVLRRLAEQNSKPVFLGVIGSDIKAMKLKKQMHDLKVPLEFIERVRCPIGMKFGNNHPHEIAISISADLLRTRDLWLEGRPQSERIERILDCQSR